MRGAISKKRGSQPRWPEKVEGMETSKRARSCTFISCESVDAMSSLPFAANNCAPS